MKYFLLKTDPQYDTYPQIIDWYKKIDHRNICIGRSHVIDHRQLFFIQENINTIFPDILSIPFFMVTDLPKDVIKMYEPKTVFKEIVLLDSKNAKTCTYHLPILPHIDCLCPSSELTIDRSTILSPVIDTRKVGDQSIFYLSGVKNLYTVARLDIIESFLRRGLKGIGLSEMKVINSE